MIDMVVIGFKVSQFCQSSQGRSEIDDHVMTDIEISQIRAAFEILRKLLYTHVGAAKACEAPGQSHPP